jgi:drug/metabolite transporter (DMT)-like permease
MLKYQFLGNILVLAAAALWATLGVFYRNLITVFNLSLFAIVFWRAIVAAIMLWSFLLVFDRSRLRVERKDWWLFFALGFVGIAGFFIAYIFAIALTGMGIAALLLYTAPVWVTAYSTLALREKIDGRKAIPLILAVTGIFLVGHVLNLERVGVSLLGLVSGLGAGLGYAVYILLNKSAVQRGHSPWVISAYSLGLGGLVLTLFQSAEEQRLIISSPAVMVWLIILGIVPTLGGAVAFNTGLKYLPASNASIVATLEPVIATLLGWAIFAERVDFYHLAGGGLIIAAVILLQIPETGSIPEPEAFKP